MAILLLLLLVTFLLLWNGVSLYRNNRSVSIVLLALGALTGMLLAGGFFGFLGG